MTPRDREAMEKAKELAEKFSGMTFSGGLGTAWLIDHIAQALLEARASALEEVCDLKAWEEFFNANERSFMRSEIRALLPKAGEGR